MKIIICDDNPGFVNTMEGYIEQYAVSRNRIIEVRKAYCAGDLLEMDLSDCDVLFLDIELPDGDGISVAQKLRTRYTDLILVFVTCWIKYAPAGYRVNAFRYLIKGRLESEFEDCMDEILEKMFENHETFVLHTRDSAIEVFIKNILYFEGTQSRSVVVHLQKEHSPIECIGKLSDYERLLAGKGFLRLQKSFLVNMTHVVKIRNYYAYLRDQTALKVSERQYADIKKQFLLWEGKII